ncbi:sulfotransferase family 2 domain-containing protein [Maliponia aquimaris]|uniref:Sulfotransferase family protein n=1 Tax=Maliponia aquimaris TaxID=1673631 RepID=A0A238KQ15_9RHOB|nr:sulfotransferase family 2 domain-containing protein [Maliponia aquimaris]SMX44885.1 Sulfotransferase family protein [Maliponia aquimaris]
MVIAVDAYNLAYVALPKAGCSSVKKALAHLDPWMHVPPETDVHTWHELYPTRRHNPRDWARLAGYYRFCVVRDPARRLMSCYTDIVVRRGALKDSPQVRASRSLPLDPDPDTFFSRLARYRRKSSLVRHHVLGASVFLGENLREDYDRVYRTDEMAELADDLSRRTGEQVEMPHANATGGGLSLFDLEGRTIDRLRPLLDEEYAFLSDHYANPLGLRIHQACVTPMAGVS